MRAPAPPEVPRERIDVLVALTEQLNHRFDPADHAPVPVAERRADLTNGGELMLLTEGCL